MARGPKALGFDYVIIGGGSASCVLAARLSEDPTARVCLVEAGGRDSHPLIHMPVDFARMTTGPLTWGLTTTPQKHALGREIPCAQARVLGGGSSINAGIFTRGHASDYGRWVEEGAVGWAMTASASISCAPRATRSSRAPGAACRAPSASRTSPRRTR